MVYDGMSEKTCEICNKHFHPEEHRLGMVVDDRHFVCESCTKKIEDDPVSAHSIMVNVGKEMPIAIWLINQENKDKHFMSMKRQ